jgi:hypothetical protein
MNWLDPPQEIPDGSSSVQAASTAAAQNRAPSHDNNDNDDVGPEMSTLNYWAHRLMPLHDPAPTYPSYAEPSSATDTKKGKEVVFVACNRVGTENGTLRRLAIRLTHSLSPRAPTPSSSLSDRSANQALRLGNRNDVRRLVYGTDDFFGSE